MGGSGVVMGIRASARAASRFRAWAGAQSKLPRSWGDGKVNDDKPTDVIVGGRKESLKGQPEVEFLFQTDR